ncbi:hypothetical protein [Natrinema thermotolerans]|uniref:hypothetical protein n=1 Tax=Natrinema thermotolerans TaxID=121872 RepID=UPI0010A2E1E1|nr:hypothetical protein [Natrinema thermotolerans]
MSEAAQESSSDNTELIEPVIREFYSCLEKRPVPVVPRAAIVGAQIHSGRSLEEANRAITAAHRSGDVAQVRGADRLFLMDPEMSSEALLAELQAYLECVDDHDESIIGAINARRQELRDGGDA